MKNEPFSEPPHISVSHLSLNPEMLGLAPPISQPGVWGGGGAVGFHAWESPVFNLTDVLAMKGTAMENVCRQAATSVETSHRGVIDDQGGAQPQNPDSETLNSGPESFISTGVPRSYETAPSPRTNIGP